MGRSLWVFIASNKEKNLSNLQYISHQADYHAQMQAAVSLLMDGTSRVACAATAWDNDSQVTPYQIATRMQHRRYKRLFNIVDIDLIRDLKDASREPSLVYPRHPPNYLTGLATRLQSWINKRERHLDAIPYRSYLSWITAFRLTATVTDEIKGSLLVAEYFLGQSIDLCERIDEKDHKLPASYPLNITVPGHE